MTNVLSRAYSSSAARQYFADFPLWMVAASTPLLMFSFVGNEVVVVVAGSLVVLSWGWVSWRRWKRPTDQEMDLLLTAHLEEVTRRSLDQNNLVTQQLCGSTVCIVSPDLGKAHLHYTAFRAGRDRVLRFTPVNVVVLQFTEDLLASYECMIDLDKGCIMSECALQYFYEDVVSVEVQVRVVEKEKEEVAEELLEVLGKDEFEVVGDKVFLRGARIFRLTSKAGTRVEAFIPSRLFNWSSSGGVPIASPEESARVVQKMVSEKKKAILNS